MEFHDLEVFLAVTSEKSFSRAAKKIFRTQPAVSLSVRRLEEELGGSLFDRSSKEPVLTDLGALFFGYAQELINLRKQVFPAVEELKNLKRGKLRVGANEIGAIYLLDHLIAFRKAFPEVKVEIIRLRSRNIPNEILSRNIDLGIVAYDPKDPNLVSSVVYEDYLTLVVYPTHPLAKKKKVSIQDLAGEVFAAHFVKASFRDQIVQTFEKHKVPLNVEVELPTIESIKKFVQMKQALALIPSMCIESELKNNELVQVEIPEVMKMSRKLRVTYLKGKGHSHASKEFIKVLQAKK